jgi:hypothetical protein
MNFTSQLLIEALVVGVLFVVLMYLTTLVHKPDSEMMYYIHFFVAGVAGHLLLELLGINRYYCKAGNACSAL